MIHFDTEFPNLVSFQLLATLLVASWVLQRFHHFGEEGRLFLSGLRHIAWAVMVGLAWWIAGHHGTPIDPGSESMFHLYKGPMRLYSMAHIWWGFRQVLKGFGIGDERILTGAPLTFCVFAYLFMSRGL